MKEKLSHPEASRYSGGMTLADSRHYYSQEVRWCAGVKTPALVDAFAQVPRERYMGPPPWMVASPEVAWGGAGAYTATSDPRDLYHNILVALDASRQLNNGQPSALARWIDALDLEPGNRVFHVGCGVGYYTAIMAEMVGAAGRVTACEVDLALAARAQENLAADYPNVTVHAADGAFVDPQQCDAILINAGVTHPHALWLDRLSEGGRMVLPLTSALPQSPELGRGAMMKIVRQGAAFSARMVTYVAIFSCTSVRDPLMNISVGKALPGGALGKVQSLRRDAHEPVESCIVHGEEICWSSLPISPA